MAKPKFHTVAAFVVLAVSAAWVLTGEFSSIGSAALDPSSETPEVEAPVAAEPSKALRTVAVLAPDFIEHNRIIRISGVTAPDKRTTLATRSAGILGELKIKKGDRVEAGDVVLVLDGAEKQSMVETAKALLDQRQKEADNIERLVKEGITPTTQIDSARSALASARSQLAEADIDRLTVIAPFSGVIDQVMVEEGAWLPSGEAVAVLLQLDPVVALGEVSEREIAHVNVGREADIRLISGDIVSGKVRHVSLEATAGTRTFPIEIAIANPDNKVPAGMTAEIMIKSEAVTAVRLPRSVVTLDAAGNLGLRILKADNTVGFVPIDLIDDTPEGLLLSGVPLDAKIIVAGQDLVSDGETVNSVPADPGLVAAATARAVEPQQ